ncbi:MAG: response regulator [Candidatus Lokiarchaeota archaeon]|nr:response regulator [Candidatus Lokiarchaeota archaeon]
MGKKPKDDSLKKDIKWYTYVNHNLDNTLNNFIDKYNIKSKAELIRKSVSSYLTYVELITENYFEDIQPFDVKIDEIISTALGDYKKYEGSYEELKQNISPLKILIFMLEDLINDPDKLNDNIERLKKAINELEKAVRIRFEEPSPLRFQKRFDILHIEDNELDRETINIYFEGKGISIHSIETSEEALDILKYATPKIILLDLDLKTSNLQGKEFCKYVKTKEEYKDIQVVIMSAYVSKLGKYNILSETLADEIIIKPIRKLADLDGILDFL